MAVKCKKCDYHLADSDVEATVAELQLKSWRKDFIKALINTWGNMKGHNYGQDILNRLNFECPECGAIKHWIGF